MIRQLHLITNDRILGQSDFVDLARSAVAAGGGTMVLHLRPRAMPASKVLEIADALKHACAEVDGRLCLNDRLDIALASQSGWAHVGGQSFIPEVARALLGPDFTLGTSIHKLDELRAAVPHVDYVIAGNVFETQSHPDRPGRGLEFIEAISEASEVPVVAIGGVTPERVAELVVAGADSVAVLSGVWKSGGPGKAVTRYLQALRDSVL